MLNSLDLHRRDAKNCQRCKSPEERKRLLDSDGFCRIVKPSDNLRARCVGDWGADKVVFISTYVDITGVALKNSWRNYYYIEICSGPGLCIDYKFGKEFIGTALASLQTEGAKYFTKLFFFDLNPLTIESLKHRIASNNDIPQEVKDKTVVEVGDYTNPASILEVLNTHIPNHMKGLNVVFVDPTDMSVPFELYLAMMGFGKRTDFIINFADGTDLKRNIKIAFGDPDYPSQKKYSKVLETTDFFKDENNVELARTGNFEMLSNAFENIFLQSFTKRGYNYIQRKQIKWYYKLLFLSTNALGERFWKSASKKTAVERENGQGVLF
ncbi:MAG: three-Cys-motif partner protein TcmP [Clostridia bacterium]